MFRNNIQLATATENISAITHKHEAFIDDFDASLSVSPQSPISIKTCPNVNAKVPIDRKDVMLKLINPTMGSVTTAPIQPRNREPFLISGKPPRNVMFEKNSNVVMFKIQTIPGIVLHRGSNQKTFIYKDEIGVRDVIAYAFLHKEDHWYVLLESQSGLSLSHSAKHYPGYKNVTKNDFKLAVTHLFTERTDIDAAYLTPNIIKYVNFYGKQVHVNDATPQTLLEDFRRVVIEWNFDLTPDQLENIFLRKIGYTHQDFVMNNRHVFHHLSAVTRYKKVEVADVNAIANIVQATDGDNCFAKKETEHFTLFITPSARYYRQEKITHIFMDGTGSLPAPYSQIINVSFYDHLNNRHRFLCCFLLKDGKNWLDLYTWKQIVSALEDEITFESASVDGERNLVQCLQSANKRVWGCHFHYSKSIAAFASTIKKKVRTEFYHVAKYFMFTDNPKETFDILYTLIGSQGERNLYNHISKTYVNIDYFQYDIPDRIITREIAARFTTSPVEGINNALKHLLKQDKSPLSIYKFIRNMSSKAMNKAKETSVYQRLDLNETFRCIQLLRNSVDSEGKQTLVSKYRCNQRRLLKWQSQKLRDDREHDAQIKFAKKQQKAIKRTKKIQKKKVLNQQGALKVEGIRYKSMYKAFAKLKQYYITLKDEESVAYQKIKEKKEYDKAQIAYTSLIAGLFSVAREMQDIDVIEE